MANANSTITDHSDPFKREQEKDESSFLLHRAVQRLTALFDCLPIESPTEFFDRDREQQATMLYLMHDLVVQADQAARQHFGEPYCVALKNHTRDRGHV